MSKQLASRRFGLAATVATAALLATASAHASKVVKDPVTGQLRAPTADEIRAEQASAAKSASRAAQPRGLLTGKVNPPAIVRADGTQFQELDESSLQYSTVTRNADGTLNFECVTGEDAANAVIHGKKKAEGHSHAAKEQRYEK